jgi:peptidoglycan lytic transglycosylase
MGRVVPGLSVLVRLAAVAGCGLTLAQCSQAPGRVDPRYGVSSSPRLVQPGEPVPKGGGNYRVGKPYTIAGRTYVPEENNGYTAEGLASWYGEDFHGRQTANGEIFDMNSISAAHPTLPVPSYVRVTNLSNRRSIIARVNDRGPYHRGRLIDVSVRAAKLLGFYEQGTTRVQVDYVGPASLGGSDDSKLEATLRHGVPAPGPAEIRLASTRPVVPQFREASAAVPTPAGRPFELGQDEAQPRMVRRTETIATVERQPIAPIASRPVAAPRQVGVAGGFDARYAPAANLPQAGGPVEPVTAFAPVATTRGDGAVMTGRGLY